MAWFATNDDEAKAIRELHSLSDRAAAIVGGALLEVRIETYLKMLLRDHRKNASSSIHGDMFRPSGALGAFSSKINLAYMLGLISADAWADIDRIRAIRNDFAHDLKISDFRSPSIAERCRKILHFMKYCFESGTPEADTPAGLNSKHYIENLASTLAEPRGRYLLAISVYTTSIRAFRDVHSGPSLVEPRV